MLDVAKTGLGASLDRPKEWTMGASYLAVVARHTAVVAGIVQPGQEPYSMLDYATPTEYEALALERAIA